MTAEKLLIKIRDILSENAFNIDGLLYNMKVIKNLIDKYFDEKPKTPRPKPSDSGELVQKN